MEVGFTKRGVHSHPGRCFMLTGKTGLPVLPMVERREAVSPVFVRPGSADSPTRQMGRNNLASQMFKKGLFPPGSFHEVS